MSNFLDYSEKKHILPCFTETYKIMDILKKFAARNNFNYSELLADFLSSPLEEQESFLAQIGGEVQQPQQEGYGEVEKVLMAYAQLTGMPYEQIVESLSGMTEQQQQQAIQQIVAELQQAQQTQQGPQMAQTGIPVTENGYYELDPIQDPYAFIPTESGAITMKGIDYPINAYDGYSGTFLETMVPGEEYQFDTDLVLEEPIYAQRGEQASNSGKKVYRRNPDGSFLRFSKEEVDKRIAELAEELGVDSKGVYSPMSILKLDDARKFVYYQTHNEKARKAKTRRELETILKVHSEYPGDIKRPDKDAISRLRMYYPEDKTVAKEALLDLVKRDRQITQKEGLKERANYNLGSGSMKLPEGVNPMAPVIETVKKGANAVANIVEGAMDKVPSGVKTAKRKASSTARAVADMSNEGYPDQYLPEGMKFGTGVVSSTKYIGDKLINFTKTVGNKINSAIDNIVGDSLERPALGAVTGQAKPPLEEGRVVIPNKVQDGYTIYDNTPATTTVKSTPKNKRGPSTKKGVVEVKKEPDSILPSEFLPEPTDAFLDELAGASGITPQAPTEMTDEQRVAAVDLDDGLSEESWIDKDRSRGTIMPTPMPARKSGNNPFSKIRVGQGLFGDLLRTSKIARAFSPTAPVFRGQARLNFIEQPLIDFTPIAEGVRSIFNDAVRNINSNSTTGVAMISHLQGKAINDLTRAANEVNIQNGKIQAQNNANRIMAVNNMFERQQQLDMAAYDQMLRRSAMRDAAIDSSTNELLAEQKAAQERRLMFDTLPLLYDGIEDLSTPLDRLFGRRKYGQNKDFKLTYTPKVSDPNTDGNNKKKSE